MNPLSLLLRKKIRSEGCRDTIHLLSSVNSTRVVAGGNLEISLTVLMASSFVFQYSTI